MRVSDGTTATRTPGNGSKPPARFSAALRKAGAQRKPEGAAPAAVAGSTAACPLVARRLSAERARNELGARKEAFREEERSPALASGVPMPPAAGAAEGAPEIRALVRALPVAIEASRVREGEPLALSFGRSLSVEIRGGTAGVEVVLRPDAALARAASAELPALVAALRARGIAVARAEVRGRPAGGASAARRPR